jgi:hypothetical protein
MSEGFKECDFCGKKTDGSIVLRDVNLEKKDGSDIILCSDCLNHYANREYDKIRLKQPEIEELKTQGYDGDRSEPSSSGSLKRWTAEEIWGCMEREDQGIKTEIKSMHEEFLKVSDVEKVLDDELKRIDEIMCSDTVEGGTDEWTELCAMEDETKFLKQKLLGDKITHKTGYKNSVK